MTRIALLVAGALPQPFPHYQIIFTDLLQNALPSQQFQLDPYDVVHNVVYPTDDQLDTYDAVIYTGSAANAFDDVDWINTLLAFTARIIHSHPTLKLIGICFGHQIIARALGASCVRNDRWEIGPTKLHLTSLAKSIFAVDSLTIQQMHRDHVPVLPPSTHALASTPTSPVQGFVRFSSSSTDLHNIHIFSIQGHPEFTEPIVSHLVSTRAQSGIIPPDIAADYFDHRRDWPNDGVAVVGKAIWRVLGVGND